MIALVRIIDRDYIIGTTNLKVVHAPAKPKRTTEDMLVEALTLVKNMNKRLLSLEAVAKERGWSI